MNANHPLHRLDAKLLEYRNWPGLDLSLLPEGHAARATKYRDAICAMLDGAPIGVISKDRALCRRELWRLLKRCVQLHSDGSVWGFRALQFKARQNKYIRKWSNPKRSLKAFTGQFSRLMERHPEIKKRITDLFLKNTEHIKIHEARTPYKSIHLKFLQMLREQGVTQAEYPFTAKYCGYRTMGRFLKTVFKENLSRAVSVRVHPDLGRMLNDGVTRAPIEALVFPFQRVIGDGHKIDGLFAIEITLPTGEIVTVVLERIWIFILMDVASRAIIGYHVSLDREYTEEDVLRAGRSALVPWKPLNLTIPGLRYPQGGGLPNGIIPELAYATWPEFWIDRAKANLSKLIKEKFKSIIGCDINAGPAGMPERRIFIERLNGTLERNGFQRLPSTTGSNPKDGRRGQPAEAAVKYKIMLSEILELTDVLIADYNSTQHSSLFGKSPLDYLRQYVENGGIITQIPEERRDKLDLLVLRIYRTVRGSPKGGKRPYLTYEGVTYHSDVLSNSPDLVNQRVLIHVNIEDLRVIRVYLESGVEFGVLTAHGYWGVTPHDLRSRRAINSLKNKGLLHYLNGEDPIHAYVRYLETKARKHKRPRATLMKVKRTLAKAVVTGVDDAKLAKSIEVKKTNTESQRNSVSSPAERPATSLQTRTAIIL
jgi:putative transposase